MIEIKLNLTGSEKQIAWAESIINTAIAAITEESERIDLRVESGNLNNNFKIASDKIKETMIADLLKNTVSSKIIDYRNYYTSNVVSCKFLGYVDKYYNQITNK